MIIIILNKKGGDNLWLNRITVKVLKGMFLQVR
jgi:hypothetical protein